MQGKFCKCIEGYFSATWQLALAVLMSLVAGMHLAAILADSRFF